MFCDLWKAAGVEREQKGREKQKKHASRVDFFHFFFHISRPFSSFLPLFFSKIGANENSIWISSNQFFQANNQLTFAGVLITAFSVQNLVAGGTQTPFQTASTSIASVKPMNVAGQGSTSSTMYLATVQTSTTILLLKYTNTNNLASNTAPTLASQRNVASSISVGGSQNYASAPQFASGTAFDGGDDRLIGLSYANGRLLASATSYYGSTAAPPKVRAKEERERVFFLFVECAREREREKEKKNF